MSQEQPYYVTVQHNADSSGCGTYRMYFPAWVLRAMNKQVYIIDSPKLIPQPKFYQDVKLVRVQRQCSTEHLNFIEKFLKPLSQSYGFWLAYEIDDVVGAEDLPLYNIGREPYQNPEIQSNIGKIMNICDFITVTTEELKVYYHNRYNIPLENIIVIPNYLPRWWIGEVYHKDLIGNRFLENKKKKHRIGFCSSSTHVDLNMKNGGVDDFTHLIPFIRSTTKKYQWVFIGSIPNQLRDLVASKEIEFHKGSDILNYPRELADKKLDAVVAPLQDNTFNRCKSNIKFLEMSALGIPCIAQDLPVYSKYTDLLFKDANDLQNQLDNLLKNKAKYMNIVTHNRNIIDYGDSASPNGWWMEKNISKWAELYTIRQKTLNYDITKGIA